MKMALRANRVAFADDALKKAFECLEKGKFEEQELLQCLRKAIEELKQNPFLGIRVPSKLWPK